MGENVIVETETDFGEKQLSLQRSGREIAESWELKGTVFSTGR